jgi:hypothetical protein
MNAVLGALIFEDMRFISSLEWRLYDTFCRRIVYEQVVSSCGSSVLAEPLCAESHAVHVVQKRKKVVELRTHGW